MTTPTVDPAAEPTVDLLRRPVRDLRVSVTDRCNFRCTYCMPRDVFGPGYEFVPRDQLLTFEEIARVVRIFATLGVRKVRLTGGEPLLRHDIERLVAMIAEIDGIDDIAMTTNGALLAQHAQSLRAAGLHRVTVSLDSVDPATFQALADTPIPLHRVLDGIEAAVDAGFAPIKLNTVVQRGVNDAGVLDLVDYARRHGHIVRFIEFMDVGTANGWRLDDVVPARELVERIERVHPLEPVDARYEGEVARRYRFTDVTDHVTGATGATDHVTGATPHGGGEIGFITSVSQPFCGSCTRARLSAIGEVYTCLFAGAGHDLRSALRAGDSDDRIRERIAQIWRRRNDRYSELRSSATTGLPKVEMSYIGG